MKTEHSSAFMQMSGWSSRGSATPQSSSSDSSNSGPGSERSMVNLCQMAVIIEESERETMGGTKLKEKTGHQNKEREATRSRWIVGGLVVYQVSQGGWRQPGWVWVGSPPMLSGCCRK